MGRFSRDRGSLCTVALAGIVAVGCGSSREAAWEKESTTASAESKSAETQSRRQKLLEKADGLWAQRDEAKKVRQAIEQYEKALELDPADPDTWTRVARAYYFLADCHLRFEEEAGDEAMMTTFEKGTEAAERSLIHRSDEFAQRMRSGTRIEEAVTVLDEKAVAALYWRSSSLGKWASAKGFATLVSYKDEVRAIMERCLELDADFFYGGPHRYFGAYYARIPPMAGRDLDRSKKHFEKSLEIEPNYFSTRVLYAEDYAVNAQKKELFRKQLQYVLDHDPEVLPDVAPENRCEQRKAKKAMDEIDEVFE